ncbi:MAG: hypothetical protein LZF60_380127 [Nitrospira sp.]|nr:MAG: hypothetical protein LZF60_380127 [Nitrospira sp.]
MLGVNVVLFTLTILLRAEFYSLPETFQMPHSVLHSEALRVFVSSSVNRGASFLDAVVDLNLA